MFQKVIHETINVHKEPLFLIMNVEIQWKNHFGSPKKPSVNSSWKNHFLDMKNILII